MDVKSLQTLFAVALIAALAPIVVAALRRPRVPQVVVLILCGVLGFLFLLPVTNSIRSCCASRLASWPSPGGC